MSKRWLLIGALSIVVLGSSARFNVVRAEDEDEAGGEVKMKIDDVPQPVRDTLAKEAPNVKIDTVDKESSKTGKITYEADAKMDGKNWEIDVDPDGKLISKKIDNEDNEKADADEKKGKDEDDDNKKEETITADQLPAPVKATLDKETAGGNVEKLEKETKDDKTVYEAKATLDGKEWKFKIRADGQLLKKELKEGDDEDKDKDEKKS
jgi:uncharacterized membrane protein YkoI